MKIHQSYLIHYGIIFSILLNNHFFHLIDSNILSYIQIIIIVILNIIAFVQYKKEKNNIVKYELFVFINIICLQFVAECIIREKSFAGFISSITVYSYIFLLFPLYVQYKNYCDFMKLVKTIVFITFINLGIASFISVLYTHFNYPITINYYKTVASIRNNRLRLSDLDIFWGMGFSYILSSLHIWKTKDNTIKKLLYAFTFLYACFYVQQTRVIELVFIIMIFVTVFLRCKNSKYKHLYAICLIIIIVLILPSQYMHIKTLFHDSFSVHGSKATSTIMRIEEVKYAIDLIKKYFLYGYGVTNPKFENAITITYKGVKYIQTYSHVDIGIIGSVAMLGISYLIFYLVPLFKFYSVLKNSKNKVCLDDTIFAYCIFVFLLCTSFTIVVTDGSRIYAWPFYLCFFHIFKSKIESKYNNPIVI